jgi:hypothetical protein
MSLSPAVLVVDSHLTSSGITRTGISARLIVSASAENTLGEVTPADLAARGVSTVKGASSDPDHEGQRTDAAASSFAGKLTIRSRTTASPQRAGVAVRFSLILAALPRRSRR